MTKQRRRRRTKKTDGKTIATLISGILIGALFSVLVAAFLNKPEPKRKLTKQELFIQRCKNPKTPLTSLEKIDCSIHVLGKGIKKIK